jgi:O-antigen ligase
VNARLRVLPLEGLVTAALAVTVLVFAFGSSSVQALIDVGKPLRWVALFVLLVVALAYSTIRGAVARPALGPYLATAAFLVLAVWSTLWSDDPGLTIARAGTLVVLAVVASFLGFASAGKPPAVRAVLLGIVLGAVLVALGGLLLLAVSRDDALQGGAGANLDRFRGLGENPNTVPMLLALALPIVIWLAATARSPVGRVAGFGAAALLFGTIVASDSRGAILAAVAGLLALVLGLMPTWPRRLAAVAALVALAAGGVALRQLAPDEASSSARVDSSRNASTRHQRGEKFLGRRDYADDIGPRLHPQLASRAGLGRLEDEIGNPARGGTPRVERTILFGSGRTQAWSYALDLGARRPLFGYGFGLEDKVFVDRHYEFEGDRPENSYIGIFLQLGAAGVLAFLALLATLAVTGTRTIRRLNGERRALAAACAGAVASGAVLAISQSYITSVGNVATGSFWIAAFLLAAAAGMTPEEAPRGDRVPPARAERGEPAGVR